MRALLALALLVACGGEKQEAIPPPLAIAPMPSASATPVDDSADAVARFAAHYERSINDSDAPTAEASSSTTCWAKECASLFKQAKSKFKVKIAGEPEVQGQHAVITMDVMCDGTRLCDRVYLLIMKDCARRTWVVDDVTENKTKRREWPTTAPGPCS